MIKPRFPTLILARALRDQLTLWQNLKTNQEMLLFMSTPSGRCQGDAASTWAMGNNFISRTFISLFTSRRSTADCIKGKHPFLDNHLLNKILSFAITDINYFLQHSLTQMPHFGSFLWSNLTIHQSRVEIMDISLIF